MTANSTSDDRATTAIFIGLYSTIFLLGLTLNLVALCIFYTCAQIRSLTTVYMKNLAVSDLLLVGSLAFRIYHYSTKRDLPQWMCEMVGLLLLVNMYGSIFLLTCISWDRCMAVCFPLNSRIMNLRKMARYICLGVWALTIGASIPAYIYGKMDNSTKTKLCFDGRPVYVVQSGPVSLALTIGFTFPLAIIAICSWGLMRAVRRSAAAQMELVNSTKIRNMIVANFTIFLLCFLPYHSVLLLYLTNKEPSKLDFAYRCTLLTACFNTVLDPLTYYFATETFQKMMVRDSLWKVCGSNSDSLDAEDRSKIPINAF